MKQTTPDQCGGVLALGSLERLQPFEPMCEFNDVQTSCTDAHSCLLQSPLRLRNPRHGALQAVSKTPTNCLSLCSGFLGHSLDRSSRPLLWRHGSDRCSADLAQLICVLEAAAKGCTLMASESELQHRKLTKDRTKSRAPSALVTHIHFVVHGRMFH